jgi:capsule polysaccharide export protein KpsE/RkpR
MFIVEVTHPYSEHSHLVDDRVEVKTQDALGIQLEEVTGLSAREADEIAAEVVAGQPFEWEDCNYQGRNVTAFVAEEAVV